MILKHPVTGHEVRTDDESVKFWEAAGYVQDKPAVPAKKAAPRKRAAAKQK